MLENMFIGRPPGNYDRLLDFSRAVTGNLFFVPSATFLEEMTTDGPIPAEPQPIPTVRDGSLGIGSLKGDRHNE
jgi:putative iron-dependent peroxidase